MAIFSSFEQLEIEDISNGPIELREEQKEAISRAKKHFDGKSDNLKFLWNAKMRFGKTICAMHLAKDMGVKSCLIVTHRPVVNEGWKEDFHKTFGKDNPKYRYGTLFKDKDNNHTQNEGNYYELEKNSKTEGNHFVFFVSMQYLCLSPEVNVNTKNRSANNENNKLKSAILNKEWDLVVIDEAHEGTRTALGLRVIDMLSKAKTKVLHLSGTPFNLYQDFRDVEIYTWDYIKEQRAKADCDGDKWKLTNPGKRNPYRGLPRMNIFTYDLANLLKNYNDQQQSFRFSEFFRTWSEKRDKGHIPEGKIGSFVHEDDVNQFLNLLCEKSDQTGYPFSTDEYRNNFRHTLWVVPGVNEAKALEKLLRQHKIFKNFGIINVAGNNEEDETRSNALDNVKNTIGADPNNRFTITISCGRLTTGVTVPPWTAVLYLKGSENTAASTYLQTIFRVQSPWDFDLGGKKWLKRECFVFDFAPDRTLRMMAETAKFSVDTEDVDEKKKRKEKGKRPSTLDDKEKMREFLNFCPVVSMAGGEMVPYDAENLFAELDRVYIDRVVRNGFNDNSLYNVQALLELDPEALNRLGELIGKSSNLDKPKKAGTVDLTGNNPKNKPKNSRGEGEQTSLSPEDEAQRQEELERKRKEREERDNRITILRGISLRIPLLIYGAELNDESTGITIDNFTEIVDDASWAEFMPRGISKKDFNAFKGAYNPTVFVESGKRIRALAREADDMPTNLRIQRIAEIFSYFHNPDKETVLTPWRVVNLHMSDCIGGFCFFNEKFDGPNQKEIIDETTGESKFEDTHEPRLVLRGEITTNIFAEYNPQNLNLTSKILEINSKTGLYPLYVAYSLFRFRCAHFVEANLIKNPDNLSIEEEHVIWDDIIKNNIYVICNTPMAKAITKRTLIGFREINFNPNIKSEKLIERVISDREVLIKEIISTKYWNGSKITNMIKFSAVVGNPPYQETTAIKDSTNGQKPTKSIFQHFQNIADRLGNYTALIYPGGRWIHRSGKGMEDFGLKQINDECLEKVIFFPDSTDLFATAQIADGISIVFKNTNKSEFGFSYIYKKHEINSTIFIDKKPKKELIPLNPADGLIIENIKKTVASNNFDYLSNSILSRSLFGIESSFAEDNENKVKPFNEEDLLKDDEIKLLTNDKAGKAGRAKWYITKRKHILSGKEYIDKWKVVVSSANAGGQKRNNQIAVIDNKSAFGRSRVALRSFDTQEEAMNFLAYASTSFIRFAFLLTDESLTSLAKWVPDLINYKSDNNLIDFSKDINEQLYSLFEINVDEQKYIENVISEKDKQ